MDNIQLRRKIKAAQTLYEIDNRSMADHLGVSTQMWERRLRNLDRLKLYEIRKIDEVLHTGILA